MSPDGDFGLAEPLEDEVPGDEFEEIDVTEDEADRIAKRHDRDFDEFRKRLKDADQFKSVAAVFDDATYAAIYKLVQDGVLDAFGGPISTGKEANVFEAAGPDGDVAVKIYRINASTFRQMREYLEGDPRFESVGGDKKRVVLAWTRKEFATLRRARRAGVRVPEPIAVQRNVLVMELIGTAADPAPRLESVTVENPETAFQVLREYMRRLTDAGLVHGDLSEYNVVVHEGELVIIDVGQALTVHHPNAAEYLHRDCRNVAGFFARQGLETDADALYQYVTRGSPPGEGESGAGGTGPRGKAAGGEDSAPAGEPRPGDGGE